jgi:hypothetical protein
VSEEYANKLEHWFYSLPSLVQESGNRCRTRWHQCTARSVRRAGRPLRLCRASCMAAAGFVPGVVRRWRDEWHGLSVYPYTGLRLPRW